MTATRDTDCMAEARRRGPEVQQQALQQFRGG